MPQRHDIIYLDGVSKAFGRTRVLDDVTLGVREGETTVIIGPSGCGKSVTLKLMIALLRPDRGHVSFDGREITMLPEKQLVDVRRRMGFLFQGGALFDSMTVEENVCFPLAEHGMATAEQQAERCRRVLALVGLDGLQHRYPDELSGGQKKRIALARAIVLKPDVIFYDEPTTGLDPIRADLINELILRLQEVLGTTAVVVTHDMASARKVGDRIIMLHAGKFILDTPPTDLDDVQDEVVERFVQGRASQDELDAIKAGSLGAQAPREYEPTEPNA
ncbi:MAG: ATP-binding cassette domain-containing protein [Planctomycetes bacterium]|jgi:phospholipid/cholesterol/gamma-HCH transport system ATP-binding protein|nr:ATP-binding cassette domain-containing protein [Phycisphaerae bacterium]NBB96221.1 ATP-binding cassette domain-containing protein [Planctomycetota bacterium]